ncbi:MAG TPA: hypothetical protein PK020_03040 [Ilumatobacteraceae bacterium]|nr:hypothetical protein [Ilumatobacteraceae bacterium]HRB01886.1 hypothetical protein [Ilumatobacteraceae bacterium]
MQIFGTSEIERTSQFLQDTFRTARANYPDEFGDLGAESDIDLLDHELFYSSPINDLAVLNRWTNFAEFFEDVILNYVTYS